MTTEKQVSLSSLYLERNKKEKYMNIYNFEPWTLDTVNSPHYIQNKLPRMAANVSDLPNSNARKQCIRID
jgi:hypothetical protein